MAERTLVTAALPYANGSVHLGHLVEYCQADIYVRALRALGVQAAFVCANDAHGTPIEMNAARQHISPEELVHRYHSEQLRDFRMFDVAFDHFGLTHTAVNRALVEEIYATLRAGGHLEDRDVDGNWCPQDKRFLPDRFILGQCPKCGSADQYGDVCEACGATYAPTELLQPRCALCGSTPLIKKSRHVFFRLSSAENAAFLSAWLESGAVQRDVAKYASHWVEAGLRDWCISRDGPYFGFSIPDLIDKFFYVWLDAPIGYIAASLEWGKAHGCSRQELWQSPDTRIEHIIGKDIVYFHTLFWPAVLKAVGFTLPSKVHVHGMLTVNGEKMSKSRGTFIKGQTFAQHVDPQALRYYYACKAGATADDLDLSLDDFLLRVNGELVNKHANLISRAVQFLNQRLDSALGDLPFTGEEAQGAVSGDGSLADMARQVVAACRRVEAHYRNRELSHAMRELATVADLGNGLMQAHKPWEQIKNDPAQARTTCTMAVNICQALAMYLAPAVPRFAAATAKILRCAIQPMDATMLFRQRNRAVGAMERLFSRVERGALDAVIAESKQEEAAPSPPPAHATGEDTASLPHDVATETITYDDFARVHLRVGTVLNAEPIKKSKKLLKLSVDLGEPAPRTIVAGLAVRHSPEDLIGTQVVVVANLAPTKLMGVVSEGMVLAAGEGDQLTLLQPQRQAEPGAVVC